MDKAELKQRTKVFGLRVLKLPQEIAGEVIAKQLMRSALSVGADHRSACRGRSRAEFLSKLGIVLEAVDESAHRLEVITEDGMLPEPKAAARLQKANEFTAIFFAAITSTRRRGSTSQILNLPS